MREEFANAGIDDWRPYVRNDPRFERPAEVDLLMGDPTKAHDTLGWQRKVGFEGLVAMMYEHDLQDESARARP